MSEDRPSADPDAGAPPAAIGFEGFVLEPARGRLLGRDGTEVSIRPKAFELLVALATAHGRPLGKAELLDRVWGRINVTEDSLFQAIRDARRAIDDGEGRLLRHVPRRGYLLDCPFSTGSPLGVAPQPAPGNDRPSIAVMPFEILRDAGRGYLALGLVEEISIALSRFRWLFVLANASAAQIGGDAADIVDRLGIRYLVEGSFAEDEGQLILRCRLVEAPSHRQIWQERFVHRADDTIALYEAMTSAIATAIEPRLLKTEIDRVLRQGLADLSAFDCYLQALPHYYSRTPVGNAAAVALLETAVARDPHFALARALLARCIATGVWLGTEPNYVAGTSRALALAREALRADRSDPQVLALCGHLLVIIGGEHAEGQALLDLSLQMNANSAEAWRLGGWVSAWNGESDIALHRLAQAERIDPVSQLQADVHSARAAALFLGQRFPEAVEAARRSIATTPESTAPRRFLVAALWHQGRHDEARAECAALRERQPNAAISRSHAINSFRHPWMKELFIEGLRGAGLPEHAP